ncbi:hypothetical protein BGZ70_003665 [Mortierella alpina]|uniref:Pyrimidine 5-nucleotidase n=1 Tax=Mortierella alpina TaxID=64518 RepID=A0A9P6IRZ6_MORAP|nr:hypothetical protein BGZ70_003665 [Mortierella alpina]
MYYAISYRRIEQYFRDSGIPHDEVERLANRYYIEYGLAIRGLVEKHPEVQYLALMQLTVVPNVSFCEKTAQTKKYAHPSLWQIDIRDYDNKVDGALPLENILQQNVPLREMIQAMKVDKKWLFTNAGETHAKRVIKVLGLEGLFHGMTFCNYLEPKFVCKPDQKSFEKAMKEAGVSDPAQCFFVDDSASNIEMATKLGWTAVHVLEDRAPFSTFDHFQIQSVLDLPSVLPRFWEPVMKTEPHESTLTDGRG